MAKFVKIKSELKSEKNKAPFKFLGLSLISIALLIFAVTMFALNYLLIGFISAICSIFFIFLAIIFKKKYSILKAGVSGENKTVKILKNLNNDYTIYKNPVINYKGKDFEFDFIILSKKGVIIVETKNYSGNINGKYSDEKIEQVKVRGNNTYKKVVKNPVLQVLRQKKILENFLHKNKISADVFPIIYFVNENCHINLNNNTNDNIFITKDSVKLLNYINKLDSSQKLRKNDLEKISKSLK